MRIVFMGTPKFSSVILEHLVYQHEVVGVFTRPDAVSARGNELRPSAVKQMALEREIPVVECTSFNDDAVFEQLAAFDAEVICVAAFGVILPKRVLDLPNRGCLNVHASLLPRWRGAAPIERAILAGDREVGVSIMRMEEGLDTGDYSIVRSMEVGSLTSSELIMELADLGAVALLAALEHLELGKLTWTPQDETQVTYAEKIGKGELFARMDESAEALWRKVRASDSSHPCKAVIAGKGVSILAGNLAQDDQAPVLQAGEVAFQDKRLYVGCAEGVYEITQIKPDGKKAMDAKAFAAGIQGIKQGGIIWEAL